MALLVPKLITLKCNLEVVHPAPFGWDSTTRTIAKTHGTSEAFKRFPYGLDYSDEDTYGETTHSKTLEKMSEGAEQDNSVEPIGANVTDELKVDYEAGTFGNGDPHQSTYANTTGLHLSFKHISSGLTVFFKAFLTDMSDNYSITWSEDAAIGRMDPLVSYQGIRRTVSITWDLPSWDVNEGVENLQKCTNLFKMLYPMYQEHGHSLSMFSPPMLGIKMSNLVAFHDSPFGGSGGYLTGTVQGFDFSPNLDVGFWDPNIDE